MKDSIRRVGCRKKKFSQTLVVHAHRSRKPCAICGGVKTGFNSGGVSIDRVVSEIACVRVSSPTKIYDPVLENRTEIKIKRLSIESRLPGAVSIRKSKRRLL